MILTETIIHHYHGAPWYQVVAIALLMLVVWELAWWSWHNVADWWRAWREEHGSTQIEDATEDDGACGECGGTGSCRHCRGWGVIDSVGTTPLVEQPCAMCLGTGRCWTCSRQFVPTTLTRDEANALTARAAERSET